MSLVVELNGSCGVICRLPWEQIASELRRDKEEKYKWTEWKSDDETQTARNIFIRHLADCISSSSSNEINLRWFSSIERGIRHPMSTPVHCDELLYLIRKHGERERERLAQSIDETDGGSREATSLAHVSSWLCD